MGLIIKAEFIINDEDFESLSFNKRTEIIAGLFLHQDWIVELVGINMEDSDDIEMDDESWDDVDL